jgi:hypothetical protein
MPFSPQEWENTPVDEAGEPPEPGTYTVVLDNARAFTSEKGDDYVAFTLRVAVGELADHTWDVLLSFKSPAATKVAKTACARIGMDLMSVASLQELDARLKTRVGEWLEVAVVESRNPEYPRPSTFINGVAAQQSGQGFQARTDEPVHPAQNLSDASDFQQPASAVAGPYGTDDDVPW